MQADLSRRNAPPAPPAPFALHTAGPWLTHTLSLPRGGALSLERLDGAVITPLRGTLWITEEGRPEDHILQPGDAPWTNEGRHIVVMALNSAAEFSLRHPLPSPLAPWLRRSDASASPLWQRLLHGLIPRGRSVRHWVAE